jgi:hypothetical protein
MLSYLPPADGGAVEPQGAAVAGGHGDVQRGAEVRGDGQVALDVGAPAGDGAVELDGAGVVGAATGLGELVVSVEDDGDDLLREERDDLVPLL